jgi:hypothetical protein
VKAAPLRRAIESAAFQQEHVFCLVDAADGIELARQVGVNSMLMFNDYDEGKHLEMLGPTGATSRCTSCLMRSTP